MKIVTIHGTFATGPEAGEKWWQKGSVFTNKIKQQIGRNTEIVPFVWDGANSEASRRKHGQLLLKKLLLLDSQKEDYVVVAHSHGGMVMKECLQKAADNNIRLDNLKRWITIGTPFLHFSPSLNPLIRFNNWQKLLFFSSIASLIVLIVGFLIPSIISDQYAITISLLLKILAPIFLIGLVLYFSDKVTSWRYTEKNTNKFKAYFLQKHLGLTHTKDEALALLSSLPNTKYSIFKRNYLFKYWPLLAALVPILLLGILYFFPDILQPIINQFGLCHNVDFQNMENYKNGARYEKFKNALAMISSLMQIPHAAIMEYLFGSTQDTEFFCNHLNSIINWGIIILIYIGYFLLTLLGAIAILGLTTLVGHLTYGPLNTAFKNSIISQAFGADIQREIVTGANATPLNNWTVSVPIPITVENEISKISEKTLRENIGRVHTIIVNGMKNQIDWENIITGYNLTYELIHNAYFSSDKFVELLVDKIEESFVVNPAVNQENI